MKPLLLASIVSLSSIALTYWTGATWGHDAIPTAAQPLGWKYPYSCCSDRDCKQAQGDVKETANGYRIVATGEIVPYGDRRIKDSPDGMFHVCQQAGDFDKGRILCLFIPPRGF